MLIEAFSDGSAQTAATDGGWAYVLIVDGQKHSEGFGHCKNVTNNDMEMAGAIEGLRAASNLVFPEINILGNYEPVEVIPPTVVLCSDSMLTLGWANGSYQFKQENKMDKYVELRRLVNLLNVQTKHVKGHAGNKWNERCDYLANLARKNLSEPTNSNPKDRSQSLIGTKKQGVATAWFRDTLYVLDFDAKIMEVYDREVHGKRGSPIEFRDGKN